MKENVFIFFSFHSYLAGYRILSLILSSVFADYSVLCHHFMKFITWSFFFFLIPSPVCYSLCWITNPIILQEATENENEVLENMKVGKVLMALQFISL